MNVPSGRTLDALDLRILWLMAQYGFIRWSDQLIYFSSVDSHVYVGGREDLTDHPDLELILGRKMAGLVLIDAHTRQDQKQQCLIGIPTAGTTLAQAVAMVSWRTQAISGNGYEARIIHRLMRQERKTHGVHQNWVNGNPEPFRHTYWIVDNTVTDGRSKIEARQHLHEDCYPVEDMRSLILVDREQGGVLNMERAGFHNIVVGYFLLDIIYAFGKLNLWPQDRVQAVGKEIRAHQLVW